MKRTCGDSTGKSESLPGYQCADGSVRFISRGLSRDFSPRFVEPLGSDYHPYVIDEVARNLDRLPSSGPSQWASLASQLLIFDDVLTIDRPVVFSPTKDKPILFAALAWAEILLTLDQADFGGLMERSFYGLAVMRPGLFLESVRSKGLLR